MKTQRLHAVQGSRLPRDTLGAWCACCTEGEHDDLIASLVRTVKVFNRVLCATEFSEPCDRAVDTAAAWAKGLALPLTVAHVVDPSPIGPSPAVPFPAWPTAAAAKANQQAAESRLAALSSSRLRDVPHQTEVRSHPNASLGICDLAKADDLLVVGTHGRKGAHRMLMGSVAERVVRHAPCAVLLTRHATDVPLVPATIAVCTDFSDGAAPAMVIGGALARAFEARATLLHARGERAWRRQIEWVDVDENPDPAAAVRKELSRLHAAHLPPPVRIAFAVGTRPAEAIVGEARDSSVDLLVLATHGRTGLARLVIGSIAEHVMRAANCPVLVVRSTDLA